MILFLRTSDIGIDAKLRRYAQALRLRGIDHAAMFWDRDGQALGDPKIAELRYKTKHRARRRSHTGLRLIAFNLFMFGKLAALRNRISLVHAIDLDTAIVAWLANCLFGIPYIYDVYDHYQDSRGIVGPPRRVVDWLEALVLHRSRGVILADWSRQSQHRSLKQKRLLIIENVPDADRPKPRPLVCSGPFRIGYLGTLEPRFRGLEDMLAVVKNRSDVIFEIAGSGALQPLVEASATACPRIRFHGPVRHDEGLALMAGCDVVLGLYYDGVPNHAFAAPNKYYEHLLLGRPMLTSTAAPPGRKVEASQTGWAISDGAAAIAAAIDEMLAAPAERRKRGKNAASLWDRNFANYFETAIVGDYVSSVAQAKRVPAGPRRALLRLQSQTAP